MRLVLDTNVAISGLLWGGPPNEILQRARQHRIDLCASPESLDELRLVLAYPKLEQRLHALSTNPSMVLLEYLTLVAVFQAPPLAAVIVKDDPDDDIFLALAKHAGARFIVSGDRHLLALGHFDGIRILRPHEMLPVLDRLGC